jgi:hypothetical protein
MIVQADSSLRFVLPTDSPYLKNMAALWAADPKLAAAIERLDARDSYHVEPTRSGLPTVVVPLPQGKSLHLHSKYEPAKEAEALLDGIAADERFVFFTYGFALGYHVELLAGRASDEAMFCVVESDLLMLRTAFEQRDFSSLLEGGRVFFFNEMDKADLFVRLAAHNGLISMGTESVVHPASIQTAPAFYAQMQKWVGELLDYSRTGMTTLILNGRRTAENITRNLGWYVATGGLARLKDRYKGKPAIIVSAGPSLRKNKHLLHDAVGKAVLVAVQTTLKPLLEMGIEPDFVTSLDYHEICTRFFENLPKNIRTELVAEPKATQLIFDMYPGPVTLLGNDYAEGLLSEMQLAKPKLPAGATVAHLAYYLTEHLGCDPVIFIGQDLGFSDGLCYTPGTSYEDVWRPELSEFCTVEMKQWEQIVRDRHILRQIPDHQGRPMYTEERLFTYLQQFERDFGRTRTKIIDATEGGARKQGATVLTLAEALGQHCKLPLPETTSENPEISWHRSDQCLQSLRNRLTEAAAIQRIAEQTLPLLEEVRDHVDDQKRVNQLIAKVDVLRNRMDPLGACYDLITQLTQTTELQRFESDRKIAASRATGITRQQRQVQRDIDNVKSMIHAAGEFKSLMSEVIDRLTLEQAARSEQEIREAA